MGAGNGFEIYGVEQKNYIKIIGICTAVFAVASILLTVFFILTTNRHGLYFVAAVWSVFPPLWFWYEYYYIYQKYGNHEKFDKFKYGQDLSKAVWVGFGAVLLAAVALIEKSI